MSIVDMIGMGLLAITFLALFVGLMALVGMASMTPEEMARNKRR